MKMKYEKPMVAVDRYELSQSIAGCGGVKVNLADSACFLNDPDVPDIMKSYAVNGWFVSGCTYTVVSGQDFDGICYNTQAGGALGS